MLQLNFFANGCVGFLKIVIPEIIQKMSKLGNLKSGVEYMYMCMCVCVCVCVCNPSHMIHTSLTNTHTQLLQNPCSMFYLIGLQLYNISGGWWLSQILLFRAKAQASVLMSLCIVLHIGSFDLLQVTRYMLMSPDNCFSLFHSMNIIIRGNSSKILAVDQLSILVSWFIMHSHLFLCFPRYL